MTQPPSLPKILTAAELFGKTKNVSQLKIWSVSGWDPKTINLFDRLLLSYQLKPRSKNLLHSLVKFEGLYPELKRNPFATSPDGLLKGMNEERRGRRAQIYLAQKDLIQTIDEDGGKRLVLTSRGHKVFYQDYPLAQLRQEKWSGEWLLVAYDFPEDRKTDRDYLRRKLTNLGFGLAQESLLITPLPLGDPVQQLIESEKAQDFAWLLRAERVLGLENQAVAEKAWSITTLSGLYEKLLAMLPIVKKRKDQKLLHEWEQLFLSVDADDPYLPLELLPKPWLGEECKKEFARLGLRRLFKSIFAF